ncbi:protein lifeguard 3-like [Megalops cyprinoides]|uniref:protein lifeguard 3-like n=1 Tax=Megalops cyprinoides TaxID=118141 RepID=UPI0018646C57|nr:protein lifeguard 3-like [Megalops cyprinoides]
MSGSDLPPSYDDSCRPLYDPLTGHYSYPPAYGPPAHQSQGQPALYPPDAGVIPAGSQPSAPQLGRPGAPPQTAMPHMVPPVIPPMMPSTSPDSGATEGFTAAGTWDSMSVRHAFVRKVYLILASQLFVTVAIVAVFTFVRQVNLFVIRNPGVYWASYAVYLVTYIVLACCKGPRRRFPWNVILLSIFTLAMSYMTGTIASYYSTKAVFLALGITMIVCILVTIFCFQTKVDITKCTGLLCILGMVFIVTGIITAVVLAFKYVPWLQMVYAAIGAIVFTLFLVYHTQLLIGNRKHAISPEEYVYAALSIYVDIIQIFLFVLQIIGFSSNQS